MFIPIGDDNSYRHRAPLIVYLLIAANAIVWYLQLTWGDDFTAGFSAIPLELSTGRDLVTAKVASIHGEQIRIPQAPGPHPIYLTVLSSMFMHASWMHIIGNMVYLAIFGDQIEDRLGKIGFFFFYIAAGVAASIAQVSVDPKSIIPCVGASGAIAGVLGAYLVTHPTNRVRVLVFRSIVDLPAVVVLGFWGVMQVLGHVGSAAGQESGVAYMAHLGGFVVGLAVGVPLRLTERRRYRT